MTRARRRQPAKVSCDPISQAARPASTAGIQNRFRTLFENRVLNPPKVPPQSSLVIAIRFTVAISGCECGAGVNDSRLPRRFVLRCFHPIREIPFLIRGEGAPLSLCFRRLSEGFVQVHGHNGIAARSPLSLLQVLAASLDSSLARFCLFGFVDPSDEVAASNRGETVPGGVSGGHSRQGVAEVDRYLHLLFSTHDAILSNPDGRSQVDESATPTQSSARIS